MASVCGGTPTYEQLTAEEQKNVLAPRMIPFGQSPIEMTISAVEYGDQLVDADQVAKWPGFCMESVLGIGVQVSTTGETASYMDGRGAFRGGGGTKLAEEQFARLEWLADHLPDDHHQLPPPERRIVVTKARNGAAAVRFYDSADLPDEIVEMLRITGARIKVIRPRFKPVNMMTAAEAGGLIPAMPPNDGEVVIGPDGITSVQHAAKSLVVSHERAWPWPRNTIQTIPEAWQSGGYGEHFEFTPDGHFLLVTWGLRVGAMLFDTATWQPVTDPRLFPQNLKEYLHSPDWRWAIAVTNAGDAMVWDWQEHKVISHPPGLGEFEQLSHAVDAEGHEIKFEGNAEIRGAGFSPDGNHVALFHGPDNVFKLRLSIFNVRTGRKERDLWPVGWTSYASGNPVWWNDGRWVVAPYAGQYSPKGTGVWDAATGRFIGELELAGCDARISPVVEGERLLQSCFNRNERLEKVLEWSVDGVRKQLDAAKCMTENR